MEEKRCGNCHYFCLHYIKFEREGFENPYIEIECGHCIQGRRAKVVTPRKKACEHWDEIKKESVNYS